jgi:hypothetical protein
MHSSFRSDLGVSLPAILPLALRANKVSELAPLPPLPARKPPATSRFLPWSTPPTNIPVVLINGVKPGPARAHLQRSRH